MAVVFRGENVEAVRVGGGAVVDRGGTLVLEPAGVAGVGIMVDWSFGFEALGAG